MYQVNHLHIVVASDENYAKYIAVILISLFENNKAFSQVTIHLLCNNVSPTTINILKSHIPQGRGDLLTYDISNIKNMIGVAIPETISIVSYARLFLTTLLPQDLDRVLYLDCDVCIVDSLMPLWTTQIDDYYLGGVLDSTTDKLVRRRIGLPFLSEYINAGMLLINLRMWRNDNLQQQFLNFIKNKGGKVYHHDQGTINAVCHNKILVLHPRWNVISNFFSHPYSLQQEAGVPFYTEEEYKAAQTEPAIIHFTIGYYNRPWCKNAEHPYADVWRGYRNKTFWKNAGLDTDARPIHIKVLSWLIFNAPLICYKCVASIVSYASSIKHK